MKVCKVLPPVETCRLCIQAQEMYDMHESCSSCKDLEQEYELLSVGSSFGIGDYAMILNGGKVERVSLDRLLDVRNTCEGCSKECDKHE